MSDPTPITIGTESFDVPAVVISRFARQKGYTPEVMVENPDTGERSLIPNERSEASYVFQFIKRKILDEISRNKTVEERALGDIRAKEYMDSLKF